MAPPPVERCLACEADAVGILEGSRLSTPSATSFLVPLRSCALLRPILFRSSAPLYSRFVLLCLFAAIPSYLSAFALPPLHYAASTPRFAERSLSTAVARILTAEDTSSSVLNRPNENRRLA